MTAEGYLLEQILAEINRTLTRQLPTQIYMACCAVAVAANRLQASIWNFGVPPAVILRNGIVRHRVASADAPLGMAEPVDVAASEVSVALEPQDKIYVYTDGMTEVQSPSGEFFGEERLEILLAAASRSGVALDQIWSDLIAFRGDEALADDATLAEIAVS